ncbi:transposase [Deinococcus hopiensis]|uniref:transposase n=1 Tax=Deinococcus hopiensis TaxID=309885 RepID=UPI0014820C73
MTPRRTSTTEFKREAVQLAQRPEMTVTQAARDLGIGISSLQRWLREAGQQGNASFPGLGHQTLTPERCSGEVQGGASPLEEWGSCASHPLQGEKNPYRTAHPDESRAAEPGPDL